MLLRSGRRTLEFLVNTTGQQVEHFNSHIEPNISEDINMANQTLKQLAAPNLAAQPPSITYPALDKPLKLNSGFLNLLPKFNGLPGEDPYRHINEFLITCSTMQPDGIEEEQIKLRAFSFSLQGLAKDWLYYMPPGSFTTWTGLHKAFLEKYFSASRIGSIRKEICGIKQLGGESLYEYWERFKRLCASCPQHQISEQLLVQYFYEGLTPQDRGMIDAASGGALVDKTPEQARNLIANMAQNTQTYHRYVSNITGRGSKCRLSKSEKQNSRQYNSSQQQPSHQNLSAEMKQLQTRASSTDVNLGNLQAQVNNRLPSQPVANPRDNVSAITLRSGKELRSILKKGQNSNEEDETEVRKVRFSDIEEGNSALPKADLQPSQAAPKEVANFEQETRVPELRAQVGQNDNNQPRSYVPKAPFPQRLRKEKSDDVNTEILETFRKISLGENVSAVFQMKLLIKCKDPGMFSIPCKIGDLKLDRAMLELGASINVMPSSIYDKVQLGALKDTGLIIQLADRSNAYPDGVLEDVLVQVNELVFPADFYVLDMGASDNSVDVPLLLGRPFLKTARTKIDVHKGNLTMEFDGEIIKFNIFDAMRYPTDINSVFTLDVIDNFVQDVYELGEEDELKSVLAKSIFDVDKQ
ncbi:uncharacterized protein LOC128040463 [Gossypium raimondii]|uniref:uncharacterized protein LOC128040463 n=1 Tax=Gossypium raimondii TaxID=29730 RepID=UPI00227A3F42|nr:uncharacterized protein LOC128040463 [Gossypium raimondii]